MAKSPAVIPITLPTPFEVGPVNCFLLKGEAVTLIDCGPKTPEAKEVLVSSLNEHGLNFTDLDQYICTHYHPDHAGLSKEIQDFGVQTITLKESVPYVSGDTAFLEWVETFYTNLYSQFGIPSTLGKKELVKLRKYRALTSKFTPDLTVTHGESVPGHEGFVFLKTPGHAPDHLSLYNDEHGTFIGGDVLLPHISSNALLEPPPLHENERPKPLLQYRDTLKYLLSLNIRTVYPGHGETFYNPSELIQKRIQDQDERANTIERLLNKRPLTVYDLCVQLFPRRFEKQLGLVVSEVSGHLDLLLDEGRITQDDEQGLFYFSQTGAVR
jgi:glyoxylase-like metal-dependent hydrolase (beta-lactamase superfamily II)